MKRKKEDLKKEGRKITVIMSDGGDMSVGIWPTQISVTFEANVEFMDNINYKNNRNLFKADVLKLASWFTDMDEKGMNINLEDECFDCGERNDTQQHRNGCPAFRFEQELDELQEKVRKEC